MLEIIHTKKRLSSFKLIALGFAGVIVLGALILMLPFSSNTGSVTPFHEALFTSTSAVCVTGLVVQDTGSYWSAFGQAVILLLIQIGGLGVVTVAATFAMLSGRKISLMQRSTMQDAISAPEITVSKEFGWRRFIRSPLFAMQDSTYSAPPKTNIHLLRDTSESRQ